MKKFLIILIICFFIPGVYAKTQEIYTFHTTKQQIEFDNLLKNLRCLMCQNQDLKDSHAHFSEDLKGKIYHWVLEGQSQQKILERVTSQYGDFILFEPPVKKTTYFLWFAPFAIFILAIVLVLIQLHLNKPTSRGFSAEGRFIEPRDVGKRKTY